VVILKFMWLKKDYRKA